MDECKPLPPGRHDHTAVVDADGALLVFGGRGAGGAPLNDLWKFTVVGRCRVTL